MSQLNPPLPQVFPQLLQGIPAYILPNTTGLCFQLIALFLKQNWGPLYNDKEETSLAFTSVLGNMAGFGTPGKSPGGPCI